MLEIFQEKKSRLLNAYERIAKSGLVFCEGIDKATFDDRANKLDNEEFILAIAGQMKAGKSTLLNALLFNGEQILPSDDTPMTAKITEIRHGDTPLLRAKFYLQHEWDEILLLKSDNGRSFFENDIKPLIQDMSIQSWLDKSRDDEISNLEQYVGKNGLYTPFVKSVTIFYPSDILKNIVIVDTPGTNDSNKFRSQITLDWIARCDAAIYSTYAGRALDDNDYRFITDYLLHLDPQKRIIAVNKIDTANSLDDVKKDLGRIKNDDKFSKTIFNDKSEFVLTAALSEVIKFKEKFSTLDEDDLYYKRQLAELDVFENSGVGELRAIVAKKLIANKGDELLKTHTNFIKSAFDKKRLELSNKLEMLKNELEKGQMAENEIEAERQKIKQTQEFLHNGSIKFYEDFDEVNQQTQDDITGEIADELERNIARKIDTYNSISSMKNNIAWDMRDAFDRNIFKDLAKRVQELSLQNINAKKDDAIIMFANISGFKPDLIKSHIGYATFSDIRNLKNDIKDMLLDSRLIEYILEKATWFWQRWFNTKAGRENFKGGLKDEITEIFDEIEKEIKQRLFATIKVINDSFTNSVKLALEKCFDENKRLLEKISQDGSLKQHEIESLKSSILNVANGINGLEKFKSEIEREL